MFINHKILYLKVIGYSSNLTIFISNTTVGTYTCHVSVPGYDGIESSAVVYQQGPPVIVREGLLHHSSPGTGVELVCVAVSVPPPTIVWRYHNNTLTNKTPHYTVVSQRQDDRTVSHLIIKESTLRDFGDYNCSASNSYGQDHAIVQLKRPEVGLCFMKYCDVISL